MKDIITSKEIPLSEQDKATLDFMAYGTSVMLDGKHVPLIDVKADFLKMASEIRGSL